VHALQVRGLQGSPVGTDDKAWRDMAGASQHLCKAYIHLCEGGAPGGARGLAQARMHLRGVLRVAEERFGDTVEYSGLQELLQRVTALEQAARSQ